MISETLLFGVKAALSLSPRRGWRSPAAHNHCIDRQHRGFHPAFLVALALSPNNLARRCKEFRIMMMTIRLPIVLHIILWYHTTPYYFYFIFYYYYFVVCTPDSYSPCWYNTRAVPPFGQPIFTPKCTRTVCTNTQQWHVQSDTKKYCMVQNVRNMYQVRR